MAASNRRKRSSIPFLLLSMVPNFLFAQDSLSIPGPLNKPQVSNPVSIEEIVIRGNKVTKDYIILREMTLKVGDTLSVEAAEFDKNRIYSLGLFNRVEIAYDIHNGRATLYVFVNERWYLFPFPIVGIKDRDWKKFYYGLGVLHYNFRGRNEKIFASFALGYDPFVSLRYRNPLLSRELDLFFDSRLIYSRVRNKSIISQRAGSNFDENHYGFKGTIGKRLDLYRSISATAGYEVLTVSDNEAGRTLSPSGRDAFITAAINFTNDSRDVAEYPSRGTLLRFWFVKYGVGESPVNYYRSAVDIRIFVPAFGGVTLASRLFASATGGGTVPNYGHVFFGYNERIRGHFNEIYEGENILGGSLELRAPILPVRFLDIGAVPMPEFGLWRFGLYGTLFADAGKVWYREEAFTLSNYVKGYGIGLNFLLPYSAVFRIEYALNEVREGQLIFDLSASF